MTRLVAPIQSRYVLARSTFCAPKFIDPVEALELILSGKSTTFKKQRAPSGRLTPPRVFARSSEIDSAEPLSTRPTPKRKCQPESRTNDDLGSTNGRPKRTCCSTWRKQQKVSRDGEADPKISYENFIPTRLNVAVLQGANSCRIALSPHCPKNIAWSEFSQPVDEIRFRREY